MKTNISINQNDFTKNVEGIEDIKQCWKNILFTIPGSIPLMPDFGCDIWQYIDKPTTDSFGKARNVIIAALEKWELRAKITKVTRTIDGSNILINIFGVFIDTSKEIILQIPLSEVKYLWFSTPEKHTYVGTINEPKSTFTITSGDTIFNISDLGVITFKVAPDYLVQSLYNLTISSSKGKRYSITVNVTDILSGFALDYNTVLNYNTIL